tara:strand:+ start:130 stop:453 length:324 start_codon:yes stop_codon:yes gene_type:complete
MENPIGYQGWPLPEGFKVIQAEPVSMRILEDGGNITAWNTLCHSPMKKEFLVIYIEMLSVSGKFEMKAHEPIHSSSEQFAGSIYQNRTALWEKRNRFKVGLASVWLE